VPKQGPPTVVARTLKKWWAAHTVEEAALSGLPTRPTVAREAAAVVVEEERQRTPPPMRTRQRPPGHARDALIETLHIAVWT
jgi:hypothetical protein